MLHHMLRAAAQRAFSVVDPYFQYVTMLLHGDGTNGAQNNTFLDSSTNNFPITRNGNTTQGTFSPYGSNWSNYFSSNSGLTAPNNSAFKPATNDFTVECWVFQTSSGTEQAIYGDSNAATDGGTFDFNINSTGFLKSDYWTSATAITTRTSTLAPIVNQWNHVLVSRTGTTMYIGLNGVLQSFTAPSSYQSPATTYPTVGRLGAYTAGIGFIGYISNFRYINGTNLYSGSSYTIPTAPLTAVTNTKLLTCADNRFIDDSTNAFTLTVNGSPSVQRFSPFSPTTAYSTSVIGGSGYFDGSGDYLSIANQTALHLGASDFSIECWTYLTSTTGAQRPISQNDSNYEFAFYIANGGGITAYSFQSSGTQNFGISGGTLVTGQWYHLACTRTGSTVAFFVNGVRQGTATFSGTVSSQTAGWDIGAIGAGTDPQKGYITDARLVFGSNPYGVGTTLTLPTAPLTAITNTQLLANFTNAGILDNAMMNDLETVGNAQISTSVKKYGTGSIVFDATDDRLVSASSPNIAFGTGDFTVEFWLNSNNVSSANQRGVIQTSDTAGGLKAGYTTGIAIYQGGNASGGALSGGLTANVGGTFLGSSSAVITTGTWYHIALVRSSGTSTIYVNGTSVGSATTTGNCSGQNICVGGYYDTTYLYSGYIDDLRITKGFARYTANFTPPTAAFPNN